MASRISGNALGEIRTVASFTGEETMCEEFSQELEKNMPLVCCFYRFVFVVFIIFCVSRHNKEHILLEYPSVRLKQCSSLCMLWPFGTAQNSSLIILTNTIPLTCWSQYLPSL